MTEILFSFDTEDFTSSYSADGIIGEAEILREEGIKGGFCIVGLLAKQLINWERHDVMEALSHHIIGNHSYGHSFHPTINEYTDLEDYDEALKEVLRQENESVELIKKATNNAPVIFACPPGNQKSYVAMYAYADMGCPIYADTVCDLPDGGGMFYCNIYQTRYTYMLESSFKNLESDETIKKVLDDLATKKRAIIYSHPHYAVLRDCWDALNYKKVNQREFGDWIQGEKRTPEQTEYFYNGFRRMVQLIKEDKRFKITNYEELLEKINSEGTRVVKREDIPTIYNAIQKEFYPVKNPCSLSISDIFLACCDFLSGKNEHVCGKVYGFLDTPYAVEKEVILSADDIKESVKNIDTTRFLPTEIKVGDKTIGPADWLRAAMEVIIGAETVTVKPAPALPSLDAIPTLRDCNFTKYRWVQSDEFEDKFLSKRLKLQCWTMRFMKED